VVAKAELHCHIEGAAHPELVLRQAKKYNTDGSGIISPQGEYFWTDFTDFLRAYDLAASLFRTREDYALLATHYLTSLAAEGAIYSEFFVSTDHAIGAGTDPAEYLEGLADGIKSAKATTGIEGRMVAIGLRHSGPAAVLETAHWIAANPHPLVTGFGMAGDERVRHAVDFAPAFEVARKAGLGITVHAGELCGAESVRDALDHIRPERIGHGVRAIEDPNLVERIAASGVVLEICPVSNICMKVFPSFKAHPFRRLQEAGCRVTLNSDDPPHFQTSIGREYEIARREFGYSERELAGFTRTAIEAAFVDEETRARLLERIDGGDIR